jgi:hypothetical protein
VPGMRLSRSHDSLPPMRNTQMSINTVVQHRYGGPFGRVVDDRYQVCGKYETPVAFWQLLKDNYLPVTVSGYICVPTVELIVIDGGANLYPYSEDERDVETTIIMGDSHDTHES